MYIMYVYAYVIYVYVYIHTQTYIPKTPLKITCLFIF